MKEKNTSKSSYSSDGVKICHCIIKIADGSFFHEMPNSFLVKRNCTIVIPSHVGSDMFFTRTTKQLSELFLTFTKYKLT